MIQPCLYTNDMQGGVENYLAQNDSNNEYKLMLHYINPARSFWACSSFQFHAYLFLIINLTIQFSFNHMDRNRITYIYF